MAALPSPTAQELHWQSLVDRDVYQILAKEGPMTLGILAKQVNMPRIPLFRVLSRLIVRKLVEEVPRSIARNDHPIILLYKATSITSNFEVISVAKRPT